MALFPLGTTFKHVVNQLLQSGYAHRRLKLNPEKWPKVAKSAKTCIEPENMVDTLQAPRSTAKIDHFPPKWRGARNIPQTCSSWTIFSGSIRFGIFGHFWPFFRVQFQARDQKSAKIGCFSPFSAPMRKL